eukprot:TRINITY_DN1047_c0_g2_i2.p1 TRINITY_DN1047_c0_g2~~TRINITY_DN1047_c0_g2_i2.p1  ORF type:complete len:242 (-),score=36.91 TRINITY_DN1047_c0_g2_i2:7-732(-)
MGFYLELNNSSKNLKVHALFSLTVMDRKLGEHVTKEQSCDFGLDYKNVRGWDEFMPPNLLRSTDHGFLEQDKLVIQITLHSSNTLFFSTIENFSTWVSTNAISPIFSYAGCKWYLKIYPEGTGKSRGSSLSVFLANKDNDQMFNPRVSYRVTLLHTEDPNKNVSKFISELGHEFTKDTDWGWKDFISIEELTREGANFVKDDKVNFMVEILSFSAVFKFEIENFSISVSYTHLTLPTKRIV